MAVARPILMTSFAFILGCLLLILASGSAAASRGVVGTAVVFGMPSRLWSASSSSHLQRLRAGLAGLGKNQ
ncbi:MAG: hypothetical protein JO334_09140 [Verrucomicrobia bacterium]|nr:hypothetical protein [Verrucomicrobiota bacterium]